MSTSKDLKVVASEQVEPRRTCLIVAGMHRSGTSAFARAANLLGYATPEHLLGAEEFNKAGHWEPERIVAVHDELLASCDSGWDDWRPLNLEDLSKGERDDYEERLRRLLKEEFGGKHDFVLKDPRICRFLPFYQSLLAAYGIEDVYALPVRHPLEVCDSLARRDGMDRGYASLVWLRHVLDAEYFTRNRPRSFYRYEALLDDHETTLETVSRDIGHDWPIAIEDASTKLREHLQDGLKHHHADLDDLAATKLVNERVKATYKALLDLVDNPDDTTAMAGLDDIRTQLDDAARTVGSATFTEHARKRDNILRAQGQLEHKMREERDNLQDTATSFKHKVAELENHATALEKIRANLEDQLGELYKERDHLQSRTMKLDAELGAIDAQLIHSRARLSFIESELFEAKSALGEERRAGEARQAELDALKSVHAEASERASSLETKLSAETTARAQSETALFEANAQLAGAREAAAHWEQRFLQQAGAHATDLRNLTTSTSWRLTRPLRGLKRLFTEPGFAKALMRGVARRSFYALPVASSAKEDLLRKYHARRHRKLVVSTSDPSAPVPPSNSIPRTNHVDNMLAPELTEPVMSIPSDGRWNIADYEAQKNEIAAYLAALSRPSDTGAAWTGDMFPEPVTDGPVISIIVRTYEGRWPLLKIALESLALQTYKNLEVIVVEDRTAKLKRNVEAFAKSNGLTLTYLSSKAGGRSEAANVGLDAASGEFIGFLDDDDYFYPDHCSKLAGTLLARPDLSAAYAGALELSAVLDREKMQFSNIRENAIFMTALVNSNELLHRNGFPIQSILFRASACASHDRFNRNLDALEDWLFWMRMLVDRKVGAIADVTSAFYVPQTREEHAKRMEAHIKAEPFFSIQRNAFYEERRLTDMYPINAQIEAQRTSAKARTALEPLKGPHPAPVNPDTPLHRALGGDSVPDITPRFDRKVAAYTSINLRYLPKALAWARSVKQHNPDWETHILLNDAIPEGADKWPDVDVVYPISGLDIPNFHSWAFTMRVVELCTATKPFYAKALLNAGFEHVFYFDPDTHAYSDLNALVDEFGKDDVLITPHCCEDAFADAEIHFNEMSSLAHGVYNLGFLGLRQSETGHKVADFWSRRLLRHCADDHGRGLFTDQKWFNLVPVFFDKVKTLKHKGCNTASWNVANRPISQKDGKWLAGGEDLIFFHFSGYDKNVPRAMFDVFGRFNEDLEALINDYDQTNDRLARMFPVWKQEWAFARYEHGLPVPDAHREIYRSEYQNQLVYKCPFFVGAHSYLEYLEQLGEAAVSQKVAPAGFIRRYF